MRETKYILDEHKWPVPCPDVLKWGRWFEQPKNRRVAQTKVKRVRISTVFLGLDHSFSETAPLVLYETMVFGGEMDQHEARYCTWEEAAAGHKVIVAKIKEILNA